MSPVWNLTPIISALERLLHEYCHNFEASLSHIVSSRLALNTERGPLSKNQQNDWGGGVQLVKDLTLQA